MTDDAVTDALADLETAADYVKESGNDYDAEMIRECVATLRAALDTHDDPSPTAHAHQMAGIRARAEHAAACKRSGRLITTDD